MSRDSKVFHFWSKVCHWKPCSQGVVVAKCNSDVILFSGNDVIFCLQKGEGVKKWHKNCGHPLPNLKVTSGLGHKGYEASGLYIHKQGRL